MRVKIKAKVAAPKVEKIPIATEFIKLASFLKLSNAAESGGMAKELVLEGLVKVNGETCLQRGRKLRPGDTVELQGLRFEVAAE